MGALRTPWPINDYLILADLLQLKVYLDLLFPYWLINNVSTGEPKIAISVPVNAVSVYPSLPDTYNISPIVAGTNMPQNIPCSVIHCGFNTAIMDGNHTDALNIAKNKNRYTNCMPGIFATNMPAIAKAIIPYLAELIGFPFLN